MHMWVIIDNFLWKLSDNTNAAISLLNTIRGGENASLNHCQKEYIIMIRVTWHEILVFIFLYCTVPEPSGVVGAPFNVVFFKGVSLGKYQSGGTHPFSGRGRHRVHSCLRMLHSQPTVSTET